MPRYFFSRTPSEKKYSPGASVVAASSDPIITAGWGRSRDPVPVCPTPPGTPLTRGCAQGQRLHHVPHGADAAVGDDGHPETPRVLGHLVDGRALGAAARHHWGGTDGDRVGDT